MSRDRQEGDLAIVGMAYRSPGVPDLFAFWENVLVRRSANECAAETTRAAEPLPLLDLARSALADAGPLGRLPDRNRVSFLIGHTVKQGQTGIGRTDSTEESTRAVRDLPEVLHVMDDDGLTALNRAADALNSDRADMAIVGYVRSGATGVPGGMAAAFVVLRRLRDVERKGARIYAILKGNEVGESCDSKSVRVECSDSETGLAGLIKTALCLHHRILPSGPSGRPWIKGDPSPRAAGVHWHSSAGECAHAVLEEHPASADGLTPGAMLRWPSEAILLSAQDRAALASRVRRLATRLRERPELELKDLAATLADEEPQSCRLGLVVESVKDLVERLDPLATRLDDPSCKSIRDGRGTYFWENPAGKEGGLAFLFPGEGSQYPGMLADLCPHFPEIRRQFDSSDRLACESGAIRPPSAMLFGGEGGEDGATLWEPGTAVNLVLSSQWAIYTLLTRLGLRPAAVVGHSSGEFLALAAAGVLRVDRGLEERFNALAVVFAELGTTGGIVSSRLVGVGTGRERVEAAIGDLASKVAVAVDNCPHQVVLAGPADAVETVLPRLRTQGVMTEDLPFGRAYHTSDFAPAVGPLREFFASLDIKTPTTPLYSCCSAGRFPEDTAGIRRLAVEQWTHPVEFRRTIETMHGDGVRVFVDVGARGNLAGFVEDTLRGRLSFSVAANLPRRSGLTQLNHLVASLFAQGVEMTPGFLFARRRPAKLDLDAPPPSPIVPHDEEGPPPSSAQDVDYLMYSHLETMNAFLRTQREVMASFFARLTGETASLPPEIPEMTPDQWSGEVRRLVPGREVRAVIMLDAKGDPVAEHHTFGGRRVSSVDRDMRGLPVLPFTVMAEMLAQVAARLAPGRTLVGLREIKARRWIRFEAEPIPLEVVAEADPDHAGEIRASLYNRGNAGLGDFPEVEGIIVFGDARDEPPTATTAPLAAPEPCRFDAHSMYAEQWLFHGPAMRAVSGVGPIDDGGIDGTLRVLPRHALYREPNSPRPLTDPIVLDSFTHLLGLWGLDRLCEGDVVFPLRLGKLEVFGDDPAEGTDCPCRIRVRSVERLKLTVDAEILRPDGRVWMRLTDWDDWRFHWPSRYRDVFRLPEHILLGVPLELPGVDRSEAVAVWLEPPADMGRPVWRDVLEQCQLSPEERSGPLRPEGHEGRRSLRLWGRIAAKEAARRLWLGEGRGPIFPADLSILPDANGRPVLSSRAEPDRDDMPAVTIAHTDGVAIALASRDPNARLGIDVEKIVPRSSSFEVAAFSASERALLDRCAGDRAEWVARFWCAKEAAAKATGFALIAGPSSVAAVEAQEDGTIVVKFGPELAVRCADLAETLIVVRTDRNNEYIWAWTLRRESTDRVGIPEPSTMHLLAAGASKIRPRYSEAER